MIRMDDRGLAIAGAALMVALSLFLAFGSAVVMKRNSLLRTAQKSQQEQVSRAHEDLSVNVDADSDKTTISNYGSHTSVIYRIVVEQTGGSKVKDYTGSVTVLDSITVDLGTKYGIDLKTGDNVGFVTRLGNTFWGQA